MHPVITSTQNPKVKQAVALKKSRDRKREKRFLLEGWREFELAIHAGYEPESVFFNPEQIAAETFISIGITEQKLLPVSAGVFSKLAVREAGSRVVAVFKTLSHTLSELKLSENPLLLVVESIEKPGNLGALLRTADAAGVEAVIVCDPLVDFYNPNVIRSSIGTVFTCQLAAAESQIAVDWLKAQNIQILCTHLEAAQPYVTVDFTIPSAIVMGTEATGLSATWTQQSDANIIIPMHGAIDSLNVSVATAVVTFEAVRQRNQQMHFSPH